MSQSISFGKREAQLLQKDHAMRNVNPNLNPNHNHNPMTRILLNVNLMWITYCIHTENNLMTV